LRLLLLETVIQFWRRLEISYVERLILVCCVTCMKTSKPFTVETLPNMLPLEERGFKESAPRVTNQITRTDSWTTSNIVEILCSMY
jgi:hypothetical protein